LHTPSPKFATIDDLGTITGMSRRVIYDKLGTGELKGVKVGGRTLIDVEAALSWMRSLPPPTIRPPRVREQAAA
jgi:hypothetical protein